MAVADVYRALADPTRRRILKLLQDDDLPAGGIAGHFDISWQSVSRHLNVLSHAGLVNSERRGQQIIYSLATGVLADILTELADIAGVGGKASVSSEKPRSTRKETVG